LARDNTATGGDICGRGEPELRQPGQYDGRQPGRACTGWGVRPYDWQFSVGVQHEILTRVAVDVNYKPASWGNHFFTDNRALTPADFDNGDDYGAEQSRSANGGGYPVTFVTRNARSPIGASDKLLHVASDFGDVTTYWHGCRSHGERADDQRHHVPGWSEHRPRRARLLRDHR
jgi:hypothetical protein